MDEKLKAIPAWYQGVKFRSKTEARWAKYFDRLCLQWQYEVEGFQLESFWYLPDFWFPHLEAFAEVKGVARQWDLEAEVKASQLVLSSGRKLLVCFDQPYPLVDALVPDATHPKGYARYACDLQQSALRGRVWIDPNGHPIDIRYECKS